MRPAISPDDPLEALERVQASALLVPGLSPIDRLWLRDAIACYLAGDAGSLDQALGLDGNTRRRIRARRIHVSLRELASGLQLGPTWACAQAIAGLLAGLEEPSEALAPAVARLVREKACPRSAARIYEALRGQRTHATCPTLRE